MNILFLVIDTLRYDYVSCSESFEKSHKTPILDEIASQGLIYDHAFSSGTSTPFSFPGILASIYSSQTVTPGVIHAPLTFAEYLKQKGYVTFGSDGGNIYVSDLYGYARGIIFWQSERKMELKKRFLKSKIKKALEKMKLGNLTYKASEIFKILLNVAIIYKAQNQIDKFIELLKENKNQRFFAFIDFMDVHGPYQGLWEQSLRERFLINKFFRDRGKFSREEAKKWRTLAEDWYTQGLEIVEHHIGRLLNALDTMGILRDTIVIITSDHGEEFLEHGNFDHLPKPFEEIIRVPLIVKVGNEKFSQEERNSEKKKLVSLVDLAPSISRFLFGEKPKEFVGKDTLFGGKDTREYIYCEGFRRKDSIAHDPLKKGIHNWCIRTKDKKLMKLDGQLYLFDLRADPKEQYPSKIEDTSQIPEEIQSYMKNFKHELLRYTLKNRYWKKFLRIP
ncbi:sulfatase [Thermotoga sp. KOL6]|uniref:sulfatase n=1 Tax=Thermotoga sp. KOL6 TaxID=126741 RepID=UPI000C75FDC7|nr:sulfatase [Thermotoga sp. KOL6]PLV59322.1 hypothetical protein AS005_06170 [Thermotoga sp. KOL6]